MKFGKLYHAKFSFRSVFNTMEAARLFSEQPIRYIGPKDFFCLIDQDGYMLKILTKYGELGWINTENMIFDLHFEEFNSY